ncbi:type II toxin-antitoxin system VapC family toxin [Marinihelvus fidelis]|uniref:Type II toxin-antitoxin system VapC family toxin n=1 Tax=Marinihelvus fidelis TaxID=2613842 RepID=A0A5N0TFP1_9GAMM|nr:type II toxin-antitoxin system VapC family toxin [Marinihelvus fidelis]KAA9132079.1 type II toxin-antitoxin system VapC family toxin [Marinihelvus fidelis]
MRAEGESSLFIAEPAGSYTRYPPLVVDCSVLAAVLFDEPERETALVAMAGKELFAPDLLDHEIVSVALKKSKAGLEKAAKRALQDLSDLRLTRCAVDSAAQYALAQHLNLTAYDAAYLALAINLRAPLATFDQQLGNVARAALSGV